jgi:putative flippase GtrA
MRGKKSSGELFPSFKRADDRCKAQRESLGGDSMIPARLGNSTLFRFLIVGGGMTALYSVLAALATTYLPLPRPLSAAAVWVLCIPLGFWCQRRFTFVASAPHRHAIWLYAATQVMGICIAATASHFLARGSFWPDLLVHLGAAALAAALSFVINRWVIFPEGSGD